MTIQILSSKAKALTEHVPTLSFLVAYLGVARREPHVPFLLSTWVLGAP